MFDADDNVIAYLSIGSNIEPEKNLQKSIDLLAHYGHILAVSNVYQSPPFGYADQPDFLNAIVKMSTSLFINIFKEKLGTIEHQLGRKRNQQVHKYGPRTIDLDIMLWGENALSYGEKPWYVPHPEVSNQPYVIIPLAELTPAYIHPVEKRSLLSIASRFVGDQSLTLRDDIVLSFQQDETSNNMSASIG